MSVLTAEQVLFLHARLIQETGGSHGVRGVGLLESAVARPQATFDGEELYTDVFTKAAVLSESLMRNHPFVDGNKRTSIAAAALFIYRNGLRLTASNKELESVTQMVAHLHPQISEITNWFKSHSRVV